MVQGWSQALLPMDNKLRSQTPAQSEPLSGHARWLGGFMRLTTIVCVYQSSQSVSDLPELPEHSAGETLACGSLGLPVKS